METSAELLYLLKFDKDNRFGFENESEQSQLLQWLFFWHGSGAPYQGNLSFFRRAQEQSICKSWHPEICSLMIDRPVALTGLVLTTSVAIERFRKETYRVFGVLELQLSGKYTGEPKEFLVGKGKGKFSIADMGTWPWVKNWRASGFSDAEMSDYPHLLKWIERIAERPAVQRGIGEAYKLQ